MAHQPMVGRFAPNVELDVATRPTSLAEYLRDGRALLVMRGARPELVNAVVPLRDRLNVATIPEATARSRWLDGVDAALVRPDGHVAWVAAGESDDAESLRASAERWIGAPSSAPKLQTAVGRIG
jgi:bifunctional hydroxylase/dehydrase